MSDLTSIALELRALETPLIEPAFARSNDNRPSEIEYHDAAGLRFRMVNNSPIDFNKSGFSLRCKRIFDVCAALGGLIFCSPLLLLVAAIIFLQDRGPVLFTQRRVGYRGKEFQIFKFRSMYYDRCDLDGLNQTTANDARITPFGKFIRKTSIDEIPQLLNIIKGDMSFVGPRPHVRAQLAGDMPYAFVVPYYNKRHLVKPGLTGWAQVNGLRGPTTDVALAKARIDFDLAYAVNRSLYLDLIIIYKTLRAEFLNGSGN